VKELIGINAGIVKTVVENVLKFSPDTIMLFLILWIYDVFGIESYWIAKK
jgi:hypothetical protein